MMGASTYRPVVVYLRVYDGVRDGILNGIYAPGGRLPTSAELARQYGVSNGSVDKAWRLLRDEGLVYKTTTGHRVADVEKEEE